MEAKRRVYQVAKEKKLSSDALISMLKGMDFDVKSHMSVVTEEMLGAISRKIEEEKQTSIEEVKRQKVKETQQRRQTEKRAPQKPAGERARANSSGSTETRTPRRRSPAGAGSGPSRNERSTQAPLPEKEDGRRPTKRRGRGTGPAAGDRSNGLDALREAYSDRKDTNAGSPNQGGKPAAPSSGSERSGRWREGGRKKRRRQVDSQAVRDNVRKTLSQMNEGRTRRRHDRTRDEDGEGVSEETRVLTVNEYVTVAELAEQMSVRPPELISVCMELGVMATINQRLDMDTITAVADEFGFEVQALEEHEDVQVEEPEEEEEVGQLEPRPAVVTVMGHVDHGKTSLLDYLRKADVVSGESGGITQHIGAYVVHTPDGRSVSFLDTPGHAAFTAMRARGARVTDLVILVVAADDRVMPQTIEAIDHAKAAGVPIVVAINKVDLPTADPDRIKRELAERDVLVEEWGGKVSCAEISALKGEGVDKLLESVFLEAEILELKANPYKRARGTIVEAQLDKGRGPVATVLVQEGTLRQGDSFVTGVFSGRVRALLDEHHKRLEAAGPSTPVQVLGIGGVPQAGDSFTVMATEREARDISQRRQQIKREQDSRRIRGVTLSDLHYQIQQGQIKELNVIVKGDVDGSVEAINQELGGIVHDEVRVSIIHSAVGPISDSDVLLAAASNAVIIGFRVSAEASARDMAIQEGVDIHSYNIIYEVVEEMRAALSGLLSPDLQENVIGTLEVRQVFSSSRAGTIAGCMVVNGKIHRNSKVRVMREGAVVFTGALASLRRFKDDVREVLEGFECGVGVEGFDEIQEGDQIEVLEVVEQARSL